MIRLIKNTVYTYNHQGKADKYVYALTDRGFFQTRSRTRSHVVLMDIDDPIRTTFHVNQARNGGGIFVYPHAARAPITWDGLFRPWGMTTAVFVSAPGHVDVLRAYGFSGRIVVAGWAYCPILPYKPIHNPRKVLFGPIHPTSKSFLSKKDRGINKATYERLLKMVSQGEIDLTVRYIRGLENNGLWHDDRVTFVEGRTDLTYTDIDAAEVVVSHQTFAYIALARGKHVVMMAEDVPPRNGGSEQDFRYVRSWDKYKDILMYPLDILNTCTPLDLIKNTEVNPKVEDWKARHIGSEFNSQIVYDTVMKYTNV